MYHKCVSIECFVRRSANVNLTQLDQNDLPRILLKTTLLQTVRPTVRHTLLEHAINQSLGKLSLVKMVDLLHQDSLRQCTQGDHGFLAFKSRIDKSCTVLQKQTVRLKTRAKIENPNLLV